MVEETVRICWPLAAASQTVVDPERGTIVATFVVECPPSKMMSQLSQALSPGTLIVSARSDVSAAVVAVAPDSSPETASLETEWLL